MAHFECLKTHTQKTVIERRQMRKRDDTTTVIEALSVVDITPGAYGHENIKVGEVYEINAPFDVKARGNTEYFKEVKKRGRPRGDSNATAE
jgi:hypothetical protein